MAGTAGRRTAGGQAGPGLFYHTLYRQSGDAFYRDKIDEILSHLLDEIADNRSSVLLRSSLMSGLTGFGYILHLLAEDGIIDEGFLGQLDAINDLALNECLLLIGNSNFDFFNGSIGILFYFTVIGSRENVAMIVDRLYEAFIAGDGTFYNNAGYLEGIHLGYAHGLPAIIKVLDGVRDNEKSDLMIRRLLEGLQEIVKGADVTLAERRYYLPRSIHRGAAEQYEHNWRPVLAWSNSDLNFSTLVYSIDARRGGAYLPQALDLARGTTDRRHESQTRVWDYRFNFGSAGVAQMYGRLYKETADPQLQEAYRFWIDESIRLYREPGKIKEHKLSLIDNLPGLYLVLLEYSNPAVAGWDKIFLL
ncbi:lanthionine synthetase LanC family protein [Puia sp. P3]|uniref:lanthionine synthetase LanC family protein n=1 Tax=Puia sp. P3 TaxID=3423952 RepID=UPI003D66EE8F